VEQRGLVHLATVEHDPFIKSQIASRNRLGGLVRYKFVTQPADSRENEIFEVHRVEYIDKHHYVSAAEITEQMLDCPGPWSGSSRPRSFFVTFLLPASLELCDTKVYEPSTRECKK
jgi:hypothetical protein